MMHSSGFRSVWDLISRLRTDAGWMRLCSVHCRGYWELQVCNPRISPSKVITPHADLRGASPLHWEKQGLGLYFPVLLCTWVHPLSLPMQQGWPATGINPVCNAPSMSQKSLVHMQYRVWPCSWLFTSKLHSKGKKSFKHLFYSPLHRIRL